MLKTVLVIDEEQEALFTLKENLGRLLQTAVVSIAGDVSIALEKLRREPVSLVVVELGKHRAAVLGIIRHMVENYPDVPVVALGDRQDSGIRQSAEDAGISAYFAKPVSFDQLVRLIEDELGAESDGGLLQSVSPGVFLQLMEMEEKTCTIRMTDKASGDRGVLFLRNGRLLDARCRSLRGIRAAHRICCWDEVEVAVQNTCSQTRNVITSDIQAIILEAMRRKDEVTKDPSISFEAALISEFELDESAGEHATPAQGIRSIGERLVAAMGLDAGIGSIRSDATKDRLIRGAENLGLFLSLGDLKAGYIVDEDGGAVALLPSETTVCIEVSSHCPRDRLMRTLSQMVF